MAISGWNLRISSRKNSRSWFSVRLEMVSKSRSIFAGAV